MEYEVKLKRQGEGAVKINVDRNGFRVGKAAHIRHPTETAGALNQMIRIMKMEEFEKVEIKTV